MKKSTFETFSWVGATLALIPAGLIGIFVVTALASAGLNPHPAASQVPALFAVILLWLSPLTGTPAAILGGLGLYFGPRPSKRWHKIRSILAIIIGLGIPAAFFGYLLLTGP